MAYQNIVLVRTDITDISNGPTVQLPNNSTISATHTGQIPLSSRLSKQVLKSHIFDEIYSASLISLGRLCDNDSVAILDKNEINIAKYSQ